MEMPFKMLVTPLAILSLLTMEAVYADVTKSSSLTKENPNIKATMHYWTAERMQNAKELTLPEPSRVAKELPLPQDSQPVFADGAEPSINLKPNMQPLFNPIIQKNTTAKPFNHGTSDEDFSSSQLVPLSADLSYPYRTVGKLFFTIPGKGDYVCSASVIQSRIILTAGHCVHNGKDGSAGFYTNWMFVPAYRDGAAPYQTWTWSFVTVTDTWVTGGKNFPNAADYAMIEMQDNIIDGIPTTLGSVTGYLGYQTSSLIPNHAHLLGYPCNFDNCQKMHQVTAQSAVAVSPNNVEYGSDMGGGSSGGPWIQNFGKASVGQTGGLNAGFNRVIGVTSWGYTNSALKSQGSSVFDSRFINLLDDVCAHQKDNC